MRTKKLLVACCIIGTIFYAIFAIYQVFFVRKW
jgi:hypothetical protein